ncbi:uncharacterized protein [Gossypium hirsutum]|uniref:RNase H type-1 domain-containing protein n=1 Tax=Gossypium hirsutum TaxID=3635 RepID=A0ABM2YX86_GOSHI|nr:uncharacterized protein LOC121208065 [Gossypium hirsutum]
MESTALNGRMARWQILLSEFDIVYVSQKAIKGSTIAEFLASRALEDYEPLSFDFPTEELMYVAVIEEYPWKLNFDGASNANNMAKYEACIMGIRAAKERKIRTLEVYGDSVLMADALATLASMIKENKQEDVRPIQMSISEVPAHYCSIEEEEKDDHPWYQDILQYVRNREYPE